MMAPPFAGNKNAFTRDLTFLPHPCVTFENEESGMATLNFLGLTNIALRLVREQYPEARLYEAEGRSSTGPTTNVEDINQWQFIFEAGAVGTAFIRTTEWGEFGPVTYSKYSWGASVVIPWPIDMDITEAAQLKQNAGYKQ